jgi:GAF domain-containing protein
MSNPPESFAESLLALNQLIENEESLADSLARVAYLACQSPIGADNAGVTIRRNGSPATAAFYGDAALALDSAQYSSSEGPCLTAYLTGEVIRLDPIETAATKWPAFAAAAAQHNINSSLSLPMVVNGASVGALNLYVSSLARFSDGALQLAERFAQQAAVAMANAEVYWRTVALTQNLAVALETRDLIGQAKGILMATHKVDGDAAFAMLRRVSQNRNIKLHDIAEEVTRTGELPTLPSN